jgi:hypothetical protein
MSHESHAHLKLEGDGRFEQCHLGLTYEKNNKFLEYKKMSSTFFYIIMQAYTISPLRSFV